MFHRTVSSGNFLTGKFPNNVCALQRIPEEIPGVYNQKTNQVSLVFILYNILICSNTTLELVKHYD